MKIIIKLLVLFQFIFLSACSSDDKESSKMKPLPQTSTQLKSRPQISYSEQLITDIALFSEVAYQIKFFYPSQSVADSKWDVFVAESIIQLSQVPHDERAQLSLKLLQGIAPLVTNGSIPVEPNASEQVKTWLANSSIAEDVYTRELVSGEYKALQEDQRLANEWFYSTTLFGQALHIPLYLKAGDAEQGRLYEGYKQYALSSSILDTEICMSSASHIWAEIQHFWPYFDDVEVNWQPELRKMIASCTVDDARATWDNISTSLKLLQDNHVHVQLPNEANPFGDLVWQFPLRLDYVENKPLIVQASESVLDKVALGDEIIAMDNTAIGVLADEESKWMAASQSLAQRWGLKLTQSRTEQVSAEIRFQRPNGTEYSVMLEPQPFAEIEVVGEKLVRRYGYTHSVLENDIHHLVIYNVTPEDIAAIKTQLALAKGIIIDLRYYPASFQAWREVLSWFSEQAISAAPMYYNWQRSPNQHDAYIEVLEQYTQVSEFNLSVPVVALSSRDSVSQNEHALAYVQNAGIPIMGEKTRGINGNVVSSPIFVHDEGPEVVFWYTGMRVTKNNGEPLIAQGISPDMIVPISRQSIVDGTDNQLDAAYEHILQSINEQ